jgi:hypothetical protein
MDMNTQVTQLVDYLGEYLIEPTEEEGFWLPLWINQNAWSSKAWLLSDRDILKSRIKNSLSF